MDLNQSDSRDVVAVRQALVMVIDMLMRAAGVTELDDCKEVVFKAVEDVLSTKHENEWLLDATHNSHNEHRLHNAHKFNDDNILGPTKNDGVEVLINDGGPDTTHALATSCDIHHFVGNSKNDGVEVLINGMGPDSGAHSMTAFTDTGYFFGKGNEGVELLVNDSGHEHSSSSYAVFTDCNHLLPEKSGEDVSIDTSRLIGRKFADGVELIVNDAQDGVPSPYLPLVTEGGADFDTRRLIGRKFGSSNSGCCDGKNDGVELTTYDDGGGIKCCPLAFSDVECLLGERKDPANMNMTSVAHPIIRTVSSVSNVSTRTDVSDSFSQAGNETFTGSLHVPGFEDWAVGSFYNLHTVVNNHVYHDSAPGPSIHDAAMMAVAVPCA